MANMEVIMQTKRAILAASAVVLLAGGLIMPDTASARRHTGQYVPAGPPRGIYDSLSGGHQPYPNPDRDFSGPNANHYGN
jgi:hypothetical protein